MDIKYLGCFTAPNACGVKKLRYSMFDGAKLTSLLSRTETLANRPETKRDVID